MEPSDFLSRLTALVDFKYLEKLEAKIEPGETMSSLTNYRDRLRDRERIRIHAQIKHEELKAEAIDILIDELHRQMRGGATVSFDHNLAREIEKLIIGDMPRAKIIALVRTGIHKPRLLSRP
jgi:hypothetical protein